MTLISSQKFFPVNWRKYPLYKDIVIPLIDHVLELTEEKFKYINDKYKDYQSMEVSVAEELISELGFGYVLDGVTLDSEDARIIIGYLKLFHLLKGSNDGFKVILDLLGYDYEHLEWFKIDANTAYTRQQLMDVGYLPIDSDPYTFKVVLNLILGDIDFEQLRKLKSFSRHYIYSVLSLFMKISFDLAEINITFAGFVDQKYDQTSILSVMGVNFSGFADQNFVSPQIAPISLFQHEFFSGLADDSISNNDYVEQINNVDLNYLFEHQFMFNLNDTNGSYTYIEDNTDVFRSALLFEHTFTNNLNDESALNNDYVEDNTNAILTPKDVVINANTVLNMRFNDYSLINSVDNKQNAKLIGTFTKSFTDNNIENDLSSLYMVDNHTFLELPYLNNAIFEGEVKTFDIALIFRNLKTANLILTQYSTGFGIPCRRFYLDYYNGTSFRLSIHTPNGNGNDYIQYDIPYTLLLNTKYLISLVIDTLTNQVAFHINKTNLSLTYVGGNHTNISMVDWTIQNNCPIYLGAYNNGNFNNGANEDMNAEIIRFAIHNENRSLATHSQSYDNLYI